MSILLVDDDMSARITLSIALRGRGFQVDLAENGAEALDKIKQKSYKWVISDIRMEGVSGIDLLIEVKRLKPECKGVLISAYDFPCEAEEIDIAGELAALRNEADYLKGSLDAVNRRIDELEQTPADES